jgi:FkbM family methyltransferase
LTAVAAGLDRIEALLQRDPAEIDADASRRFFEIARPFERQLVLFGAGQLGRITLEGLHRAGADPVAFADNNVALHGSRLEGVPVVSPEEAAGRWKSRATFVVTVYNVSAPFLQLRRAGAERIVSYAYLFAFHRDHLLPFMCLGPAAEVMAHAAEIREAYGFMADERSRQEFIRQLERRLFIGFDEPRSLTPGDHEREYFPEDVYAPLDDEVFVDCGAYDGDTIRRFLQLRNSRFERIVALEPDPSTFTRLQAFVGTLPPEQAAKIRTERLAVLDRRASLSFHASGSVVSGAKADGDIRVDADTLDHILSHERPTLIKMDLEGGEPEALDGARQTTRRNGPILAVCVYHRAGHLWKLPLLMHQLAPEHAMFLRAHSEDCWDVSCYLVPRGRLSRVIPNATSADRGCGADISRKV